MMQLACMGPARQCPPTGPQGKYQLVASSLSTLVLLLTGGPAGWVIYRIKKNYRLGTKTSQSGPIIMFLF